MLNACMHLSAHELKKQTNDGQAEKRERSRGRFRGRVPPLFPEPRGGGREDGAEAGEGVTRPEKQEQRKTELVPKT